MNTTFIDDLASSAPTPGGGGASAYCGALAAALASMVGNLTVGKARYVNVELQVKESLTRLDALRGELVELVEADARAYQPVAAVYRMPKNSPEEIETRNAALQNALVGATEVPLQIMRACCSVIDEADFMAHNGSRLAISDAGSASTFAKAALEGASLNVRINIASLDDGVLAAGYEKEMNRLLDEGCALANEVYDYVISQL